MIYPSLLEIEQLDIVQLARYIRFLPSPGTSAIGQENFDQILHNETMALDRIMYRFYKELGGWTPELSKRIGW